MKGFSLFSINGRWLVSPEWSQNIERKYPPLHLTLLLNSCHHCLTLHVLTHPSSWVDTKSGEYIYQYLQLFNCYHSNFSSHTDEEWKTICQNGLLEKLGHQEVSCASLPLGSQAFLVVPKVWQPQTHDSTLYYWSEPPIYWDAIDVYLAPCSATSVTCAAHISLFLLGKDIDWSQQAAPLSCKVVVMMQLQPHLVCCPWWL